MAKILVMDDDLMTCQLLCEMAKRLGCEVAYAQSIESGLEEVYSGAFDVVFLDVNFPDGNGLDVLSQIREAPSTPEVIIITGEGDPNGAELAIRSGAWDYVEKPSSFETVKLLLVRALRYHEQKKTVGGSDGTSKEVMALKREGIIGSSPRMKKCLDLLAQAASSDANVLITGETGTGKELFAWAIHENSPRAGKPFVVVDCAALPETLVESMLFGHEKGVFTGADRAQDGMIKQADGGTLVLDEVGELPLSVQKAFLRVLQERRFRPLGGKQEVSSDFRLIAATNRDIPQMVSEGQFRKDLFFRLHSFTLELPPLRERTEDIKELAMFHMAKLCERYGTGTKGFSPEFMEGLKSYDWPGNVRELAQSLEGALTAARGEPTLFADHLPIHIRIRLARASVGKGRSAGGGVKQIFGSKEIPSMHDFRRSAIAQAEKEYLQELLALTHRNIKECCRLSGLSRPRLYALMKEYGITGGN